MLLHNKLPGSKRPGRPPGSGGADQTRERILEAAADVFADKGYYGAAVDDIVRASDTSKGSFYFHFPNKRGIFTALLDHLTGRLFARVEAAIETEPDPVRKLDSALGAALAAFAQRKRLARLLLVEAAGLGHAMDEHLMAVHERFIALIKRHLDQAVALGRIAPLDTQVAAAAWMGALNEIVIRWLHTEQLSTRAAGAEGVRGGGAGQPAQLQDATPTLRALLLRSVGIESLEDERES